MRGLAPLAALLDVADHAGVPAGGTDEERVLAAEVRPTRMVRCYTINIGLSLGVYMRGRAAPRATGPE